MMKKIKVAINGFGRIGRVTFRQMQGRDDMEVVAINDITDSANLAHLLKYDSVQRQFNGTIEHNGDHMVVNGKKVLVFTEESPSKLPWKKLGIDVVIEATGQFIEPRLAMQHISPAGARKVIISAPAKVERDDVEYVVLGVNEHIIDKNSLIISNAS